MPLSLRDLVHMSEGRADNELDLFWLHQDDAWLRTSQLLAMLFNTTRSEQSQCKEPHDFNILARWLAGEDDLEEDERDDFAWIEEEEKKKRSGECLNGHSSIN